MPYHALGAVDTQVVPRQGVPDGSVLSHVPHGGGGAMCIYIVHMVSLDSRVYQRPAIRDSLLETKVHMVSLNSQVYQRPALTHSLLEMKVRMVSYDP